MHATPQSCPLSSACALWHPLPYSSNVEIIKEVVDGRNSSIKSVHGLADLIL